MLASSYVNGFGLGTTAPSLLQLIDVTRIAASTGSGFGGFGAGSSPIIGDFVAFQNGPVTATYKDTENLVYCNKDSANRPQCTLNKLPPMNKAPIRDLQRAVDRIIDLIPTNQLEGRQMRGQVPQADGTTRDEFFTVPSGLRSPIAAQSGIDGIVGPSTSRFAVLALTLAGMLKKFPNPGVALAFVSPTRDDIFAKFSTEIANYLEDVAANFGPLLQAFEARGNTPVQTQLDVKTIPYVVPLAAGRSNKGIIIGTAAAMVGLTAIAAVSAAKHKPDFAYADTPRPALGRRKRRSRR